MRSVFLWSALLLCPMLMGCVPRHGPHASGPQHLDAAGRADSAAPYVLILGTAQDGGYPQAGCRRTCCEAAWRDARLRRTVACIALVDPQSGERWLFDATPDFREQLHMLDKAARPDVRSEGQPAASPNSQKQAGAVAVHLGDVPEGAAHVPHNPPAAGGPKLAGIFLTHAHIGHYTGLMHLGREAIGASGVPVYVMPRMQRFLETQGPWDQLVRLGNIALHPLADRQAVELRSPPAELPPADGAVARGARLRVTPLLVPHRDEYSETVGFRIDGPSRSLLFIPDIDKWERWDHRIEDVLAGVDVALLDGTFYDGAELPNRDMREIPHPFIVESLERFVPLPAAERAKVRFIHLNHTNPALRQDSEARREIERRGLHVAEPGERIGL